MCLPAWNCSVSTWMSSDLFTRATASRLSKGANVKRSERLVRNTLGVLAALIVAHVAVSRVQEARNPAARTERTPPAVLASLRDFTAIQVEGDFTLDVERAADYAVDFTSPDAGA